MRILLIAVLLALISMQADALMFEDGVSLKRNLAECDNKDAVSDYRCGEGVGFINGTHDAYDYTEQLTNCKPESLIHSQLRDVIMKWLNDHPERLHEGAAVLVLAAINEAWPCPE